MGFETEFMMTDESFHETVVLTEEIMRTDETLVLFVDSTSKITDVCKAFSRRWWS